MVTIKRHRIDSGRKALIYNLLRCPDELKSLLHRHYDSYVAENSAVPHDVLVHDYYVPGSTTRADADKYRGKSMFAEILKTSEETCMCYFSRVIGDFCRNADKDATRKCKKQHQLDENAHVALHDNCCLWLWIKVKMENVFPGDVVARYQQLFDEGLLF